MVLHKVHNAGKISFWRGIKQGGVQNSACNLAVIRGVNYYGHLLRTPTALQDYFIT